MAGRVLSRKNESALRAALEQIGVVLAALAEDEDSAEGEGGKGAPKAGAKTKEAAAPGAADLAEAASIGTYIEAETHTSMIARVNGMYGEGRLNRPERDAMIGAASAAVDAFRQAVEAGPAADVYARSPWQDAPEPQAPAVTEATETAEAGDLAGEFVPLSEAAVRKDGTATLKIIAPGWGSSGYYPADVLKRDGPGVFAKGTKGFWDHPTATEEAERPEGTLSKLASELVSDARYLDNGPAGPGLYADAKIFKPYQEAVAELAPHIGVSIRAAGRTAQGEAEGRKGPIVQQLVAARSVDWVTVPGAGGQVVEMFEAARSRPAAPVNQESQGGQMDKEFETKLQERLAALEAENARLREAQVLRDAREIVREGLAGATVPDVTRARLLESLSANPPIKEGSLDKATLLARVTEAIKAEQAYLAEAAGYGSGRITGMGGGQGAETVAPEDQAKRLREAFGALGLSDKEAADAAAGRRW